MGFRIGIPEPRNLRKRGWYRGAQPRAWALRAARKLLLADGIEAADRLAHGVEDGEPVGVDALGRLPFVLTERGESYRLELDRLLAERDVTIEPLVEAGNTETLVHLAERGVGATFVPRFSAANELASGTLVELGSDMSAVRMETQMLWHARKWIAPHLAEFIQVTRRFFAS